MKDPVLESYQKDFAEEHKRQHLSLPDQFEHFVNFCVMAKHYTEPFDPDEVAIGGQGDLGIDGVGIFVNDHLVLSREDIDYLRKNLRRLDVEFVFVQSKTSSSFDGGDIGTFIAGVRQFFDDALPVTANMEIREFHRLKQYIYELTIDMDHSPLCHLYYAATGTWTGDAALIARTSQGEQDLRSTNLFSDVRFIALDAERLKKVYREIKNKFVRELSFEKHAIIPEINGVAESYIGVVPAQEYLKILCDEDGILNRRLFYDNVRDFQGHNAVNSEIRTTITSSSQQDRFSLLNNGVTIVAKDVNKIGSRFRLRDYQVVNGCQTSHVLYLAREHLSPSVFIPIKLIVTNDVDITNQIIQGANRQTEIKPEAFESLAPFQKELEEMYIAVSKSLQADVFYERRSKQYDDLAVSRDHIITLPAQIKSFVGMFLNEPHSTHRYYGELLDSYRSRIFNETHRLMPYVTAGVSLAMMERLFTEDALPKFARQFRHQMLMVFRIKFGKGEAPPLNSKKVDDYCANLLAIVNDKEAFKDAMVKVAASVEQARSAGTPWREPPERTRSFTSALLDKSPNASAREPAKATQDTGTIQQFSTVKGYGFIKSPHLNRRVFIHKSALVKGSVWDLTPGRSVTFNVLETEKGPVAKNVTLG